MKSLVLMLAFFITSQPKMLDKDAINVFKNSEQMIVACMKNHQKSFRRTIAETELEFTGTVIRENKNEMLVDLFLVKWMYEPTEEEAHAAISRLNENPFIIGVYIKERVK